MDRLILIFDGECNLCNRSIQFILRHDAHGHIHFATRQSPIGQTLLKDSDALDANSIVVLDGKRILTESTAAIRIAREFAWPWRAMSWVWIVPRPLRNWGYRIVARYRYTWFGRRAECWLPTPELRRRFLDQP